MKKTVVTFILICGLLSLFTLVLTVNVHCKGPTIISVCPSLQKVSVANSFTVGLNISDVADLYLWVVTAEWNSSIIEFQSYEEGPFLKAGGNTTIMLDEVTPGRIEGLVCTILGHVPGVSGNGSLVTMMFNATALGTTSINVTSSALANSNGELILHSTFDGVVQVTSQVYDIAVTSVNSHKTIVGQGFSTRVNVTVENHVNTTAAFNVTLYANTTIITAFEDVTLSGENSSTINFTWNTASVDKGNYTLSANANLEGDVNVTDNTFTDGWIVVTIPGDINGDGEVDWKDLLSFAQTYGSEETELRHVPEADFNSDGKVDWQDLLTLALHYGEH